MEVITQLGAYSSSLRWWNSDHTDQEGGWTRLKAATLGRFSLAGYVDDPNLRTALINASRIDHPTFANFIAAFSNLYNRLSEGRSKSQILQSIQVALEAITSIIGIQSDHPVEDEVKREILRHIAEVFKIPDGKRRALTALFDEITLWHKHLKDLQGYMQGSTEAYACTRATLKDLLRQTKTKLLCSAEGGVETGFLEYLKDVQYRQQGNLTGGLSALFESIATILERSVITKFNARAGTSIGLPSPFTLSDDPSIPGREILDDGSIKINAHKESPSVLHVVIKLLNPCKIKEDFAQTQWRIDLLLPILEYIRFEISKTESKEKTPILHNLDTILGLLTSLKNRELSQGQREEILTTVRGNLDTSLIGIMKYLPYLPLTTLLNLPASPSDNDEIADPIQELQASIQSLQGLQTATRPEIDDKTLYEKEFREFKQTAAWMSAYKAIEWFIGKVPSYVTQKPMSFAQIMTNIYRKDGSLKISDPIEQHNIFIDTLLENINRSSHLFFFTRFLLGLFVPMIVHISNFTIARIVSGTKRYVDNVIQNAHSPVTGESNTVPLDLFAEVGAAYINAHKIAAESTNLGLTKGSETIEDAFYKDPKRHFLRGHPGRASVYSSLGEAIIDEFLASLNFTKALSHLNVEILTWSQDSDWFIIQSIFWAATAPIRLTLTMINTLIFYPIEQIANNILYYAAKTIVNKTSIAEQITNLTLDSLTKKTDFTSVLDEVLLDLLKMLWDLLQAPRNPNDKSLSDLHTTPETTTALSKALATLIDAVAIGDVRNTPHDIRNFQNPPVAGDLTATLKSLGTSIKRASLDGVSTLLDKSWQLLLGKGTKLTRLLLHTVNRSMRSNGQKLTAITLATENQQHNRTKDLTQHYLKLLLWECVKIGTIHLKKGPNAENEINKHIEQIQKNLGFTTTDPSSPIKEFTPASEEYQALGHKFASKINRWHKILIDIANNNLPDPLDALQTIHTELLTISTSMQHELSLMESQGSVEKSARDAHEKNVLPLSRAIHEFTNHFFAISDHIRKANCNNKGQLGQAIYAVGNIKDRALQLATSLQNAPGDTVSQAIWLDQIDQHKIAIQHAIETLTGDFSDITGPLPGLTNASTATLESLDRAVKEETSRFDLGVWTTGLVTNDRLLNNIIICIQTKSKRQLKALVKELDEKLQQLLPPATPDVAHYKALKFQIENALTAIQINGDANDAKAQARDFYESFTRNLQNLVRLKGQSLDKTLITARSNFINIANLAETQVGSLTLANPSDSRDAINLEQIPIQAAKDALIKIENAAIGLKDIHKLTLDVLGQLPFLSMAQRGVFDYTKNSIEKALRQIFTDREFLEGFAMRAFIEFLENHGKSRKHEAIR